MWDEDWCRANAWTREPQGSGYVYLLRFSAHDGKSFWDIQGDFFWPDFGYVIASGLSTEGEIITNRGRSISAPGLYGYLVTSLDQKDDFSYFWETFYPTATAQVLKGKRSELKIDPDLSVERSWRLPRAWVLYNGHYSAAVKVLQHYGKLQGSGADAG